MCQSFVRSFLWLAADWWRILTSVADLHRYGTLSVASGPPTASARGGRHPGKATGRSASGRGAPPRLIRPSRPGRDGNCPFAGERACPDRAFPASPARLPPSFPVGCAAAFAVQEGHALRRHSALGQITFRRAVGCTDPAYGLEITFLTHADQALGQHP